MQRVEGLVCHAWLVGWHCHSNFKMPAAACAVADLVCIFLGMHCGTASPAPCAPRLRILSRGPADYAWLAGRVHICLCIG